MNKLKIFSKLQTHSEAQKKSQGLLCQGKGNYWQKARKASGKFQEKPEGNIRKLKKNTALEKKLKLLNEPQRSPTCMHLIEVPQKLSDTMQTTLAFKSVAASSSSLAPTQN